jgi:hypothetical protein
LDEDSFVCDVEFWLLHATKKIHITTQTPIKFFIRDNFAKAVPDENYVPDWKAGGAIKKKNSNLTFEFML